MRDKLYIDGAWVSAAAGGTLDVINPATEERIHQAPAGTSEDVAKAVVAARSAFDRGWGQSRGRDRAPLLRALSQRIMERKSELARLEVIDNGKPLPEAEWDIDDAAACFSFYADLAEELDERQGEPLKVSDERFDCRMRYEPVGVAGQIIPWNYPLLMATWKVAPALAAGCTCVLKPSELTPLTALELGAMARDVDLPRGVLNVVTGTGQEAGAALSQHPEVDRLAFTGSVAVGRRVMQAAGEDIKSVSLELGGKSPFIVFDDADVEQAVEWVMFGIFWNQGQVCSATSRLIVHEDIAPRLFDRLAVEARKIVVGDGFAAGTLLGPLVSQGQYDKVVGYVRSAADTHGIELLTGGQRPAECDKGYFLEPTVFVDVPQDAPLWTEEVFGPVLAARTFRDEAEAVRLANDTNFGLAAAVMSADLDRCDRVAAALRAGILWINCSQPTFCEAPWGGMKRSGVGRELGRWGLDNYLEPKQLTRYTSSDPWGWYIKGSAS